VNPSLVPFLRYRGLIYEERSSSFFKCAYEGLVLSRSVVCAMAEIEASLDTRA
jgi:hypothetical protein